MSILYNLLLVFLQANPTPPSSFFVRMLSRFEYLYDTYDDFIFGLLIGIIISTIYTRFVSLRSLMLGHKAVLDAKDQTIRALEKVISTELDNIEISTPEKESTWKKIKGYFSEKW